MSVVLWRNDRLLLAHHRAAGVWSTPGGAVEPGETLSAACRREAREELGISVDPRSVAAVIGPDEVRYPNGDRTAYVTTAFACRADDTPVADEPELDQLLWVGEDDVPQLTIAPCSSHGSPTSSAGVKATRPCSRSCAGPRADSQNRGCGWSSTCARQRITLRA
ncbi:MAG: NUDIX domain-containing protein, partial [Actinobacteria bacterium]|nr:NUDIX domain-containing protein [Actinomycetota bacterium]